MPNTTPLLLLVDSMMSEDQNEVQTVMQVIQALLKDVSLPNPLQSTEALCRIISELGKAYPDMAGTPSSHDGSLPLHFAATLGKPMVAQALLSLYPDAATKPNAKGKIPLHYAAREGKLDMVRFFLQTVPQTASIASDKDKLALHFAAGDGHVQVVRDLLTVHPAGATLPSAKGKLPLHLAARWGHLQIAHDLLSVHPAGVSALDWDGSLPLHDAAREGQYRMARYLIERYPLALCTANLRSEIPLFPAVRSGNIDLIVLLAQAWPRGAQHVLANLCAADNVNDPEILELLLRAAVGNLQDYPLLEGREPPTVCLSDDMEVRVHTAEDGKKRKSKKKRDYSPTISPFASASNTARSKSPILASDRKRAAYSSPGQRKRLRGAEGAIVRKSFRFFALHAAFQAEASEHVIETILEQQSDQLDQCDDMGRLPLHWALANCCRRNDKRVPLVLKLITPERASIREDEGDQLPLHIAIAAQADVRVLSALLEACPTAGVEHCKTCDEWHDKLPIEMAVHYDCDLGTIYKLLRVDPGIVQGQA